MKPGNPISKVRHRAVLKPYPGLRACFLLFATGVLLTAAAFAAPGAKAAGKQAAQPAASEFVGSETCAGCHEEVSKGFASNPHVKMAQMHGHQGVTCENCHGAGKAHVDGGGDTSKIFNPAKATPKEIDEKCLSSHSGQHANFERSGHGEGNVSCIGCHSVHASKEPEHLLKAAEPVLCFQCHSDVKPQFSMPFHHRVEEGAVSCSDCHNPHGSFRNKGLRSSAQQDAVCTKCHSETAGPYVYEHAVVKTEGCMSCHTPHGGPNPRLLNRANVNTICLQCHSPSTNFSTSEPVGPTHNQAAQYQACTVCHSEIHGSNVSPVFFNTH
jgi:DmsE family decaheme c-type cytochrome